MVLFLDYWKYLFVYLAYVVLLIIILNAFIRFCVLYCIYEYI